MDVSHLEQPGGVKLFLFENSERKLNPEEEKRRKRANAFVKGLRYTKMQTVIHQEAVEGPLSGQMSWGKLPFPLVYALLQTGHSERLALTFVASAYHAFDCAGTLGLRLRVVMLALLEYIETGTFVVGILDKV